MTMRRCGAIRQPDVVTLLHQEFGAAMSWRDFLADCIRSQASIQGLTLRPVGYERKRGRRPLYDRHEVDRFVVELRRLLPPKPIEVLDILVDDSVAWIPPHERPVQILGSSTVL